MHGGTEAGWWNKHCDGNMECGHCIWMHQCNYKMNNSAARLELTPQFTLYLELFIYLFILGLFNDHQYIRLFSVEGSLTST